MFENCPYHRRVFNKTDNPHSPLTFWADQGINLVYLLNQPGPAFLESFFASLRFEDAGDSVIRTFLSAFAPRNVAVIAVISHHLLAPVRDVGTHRGQPFRRREVPDCRAVLGCINDRPLLIQVSRSRTGNPQSSDASGRLGVTTWAMGSSTSLIVTRADSERSISPLFATMTGSTTRRSTLNRLNCSATARTISGVASIPVFAASVPMSDRTESICSATKSAGTG